MATGLFYFRLRSGRGLVRLRQRTRQIAGLLGFAPPDRSWIAATVFELAWQTWRFTGQVAGCFRIHGGRLQVRVGRSGTRFVYPLPSKPPDLAAEDLAWAIEQLQRHTPLRLLEEIRLQNQELLQALDEGRGGQTTTNPAA
jgi:hypothetical protein